MKRLLLLTLIFSNIALHLKSQSMDNFFRQPVVEEGENNIILQNRCGNRLTLMFKPNKSDLEFVYKPNAFRRKDFWARNFSNRDNQTLIFKQVTMPDIRSIDASYEYDPFITKIKINAPSGAKNTISVVNLADENAFVVSARSPLLLAIKPHVKFEVSNGLLYEKFTERGEDIVSFIKFPGFEQNRFRILADGTYILQILENDVLIFGAEENMYQVNRLCTKYQDFQLTKLIEHNEALIQRELSFSKIYSKNADFNMVMEINKRILYSMVDEGGATFGALNRIYYLIWVRDGSMATSLMARGGFNSLIPQWTNLTLNNPAMVRRDDGTVIPEFGQTLGTRWGKSEDDGIFYATLSLFTLSQTTGNNELLYGSAFKTLLESIDRYLDKTWEPDRKMTGSDTRGETTLKSSPYYGYDVVNGEMYHNLAIDNVNYTPVVRSYSLYQQVNTYNLLLMANVMLAVNPEMDDRSARYAQIADQIKQTLQTKFINNQGNLYSGFEIFADGSEKWIPFGKDCDYWETAWANSLGPYYPLPDVQLKSAIEIKNDWTKYRNYGYCPWNTLSRYLYEYGMSSEEYEKMLSEQIKDALTLTKKYPMRGAVTEYQKEIESWRALPFQIGALYYSLSSLIIQSMPMGIASRASNFVDSIQNYAYKSAVISAKQFGTGDEVKTYKVNNTEILHTLQIPANQLRIGRNEILIERCSKSEQFRLYSSNANLLSCSQKDTKVIYHFSNPVSSQLIFDHLDKVKSYRILDKNEKEIDFSKSTVHNKTMIEVNTTGDFILEVEINGHN